MAVPREAEGHGAGSAEGGTMGVPRGGGAEEAGNGASNVGQSGGQVEGEREGQVEEESGGQARDDRPLIEPQRGPGLQPSSRPDPVMVTSAVFALLALIPTTVFRGPNVDLHLGPLQIPVIFAIVAVLFAVLGFLRGHELEDRFIQRVSIAAGAVGLVRLFVYPLLGL